MKAFRWILIAAVVLAGGGWAQAMEMRVQTGLVTNWWDSDTNDRGNQTYVPVTIDAVHEAFSVRVLSALVTTRIDPSDGGKHSMTTAADTKVNLSYGVVDRWPVDVLVGLDVNLPTGRTHLDSDERRLLLDPDLVTISRYGEGFNVNPTLTIAKQGERWGAGLGVGYLWRGEYDFSDVTQDFDPGDIFNITGEAIYAFSDRWQGRLFGEVAWYDTDQVRGRDYYQEGDFILIGMGVDYFQTAWEAAATVKHIIRGKSDFAADGRLATEARSGYGDEYIGDLTLRYPLDDATTLGSRLYYLLVMENDYDRDDPAYIDRKQKVSLGLSLQHQFSAAVSGRIGLEGFLLDEGRTWYHEEDRTYRGVVADLAVRMAF